MVGIAIDALNEFASGYERHRPRTRFFSFFVSDVSDTRARFWASRNPLLSSSEHDAAGRDATAREVATITLDDLLTREGVTKVDFLTMDIELAEPKALAGFDLQRFRPESRVHRGASACPPIDSRLLHASWIRRRGALPQGRRAEPVPHAAGPLSA